MGEAIVTDIDRWTGRSTHGAAALARRLSPAEIDALAGFADAAPAELALLTRALRDMPARRRAMLEPALTGSASRTEIARRFHVRESAVDHELRRALRQSLEAVRIAYTVPNSL